MGSTAKATSRGSALDDSQGRSPSHNSKCPPAPKTGNVARMGVSKYVSSASKLYRKPLRRLIEVVDRGLQEGRRQKSCNAKASARSDLSLEFLTVKPNQ